MMPTGIGTYPVQDGVTVLLTLDIGEGQVGHSTVFVGADKKASRRRIQGLELGDGADLRGKVLVSTTTVVDLQQDHDRTSVTLRLEDGSMFELPRSEDAAGSGVVVYLFVITFA